MQYYTRISAYNKPESQKHLMVSLYSRRQAKTRHTRYRTSVTSTLVTAHYICEHGPAGMTALVTYSQTIDTYRITVRVPELQTTSRT